MRYFEIASGIRLPLCSEEQELLTTLEQKPTPQDELDERAQELARQMVSRGALTQYQKDNRVYYRANSMKDIWRDKNG